LPAAEQVEALIGCEELGGLLEGAPDRLGFVQIVEDVDRRDAACSPLRSRLRRPAFHRRSHSHSRNLSRGFYLFRRLADLCKEVSTKGKDNGRDTSHRSAPRAEYWHPTTNGWNACAWRLPGSPARLRLPGGRPVAPASSCAFSAFGRVSAGHSGRSSR